MVSHGVKLADALKCIPRRILVVEKQTRLARETRRHPDYLQNLQNAGRLEDRNAVQTRHDVHKENLHEILKEFRKHFAEVELVDEVDQDNLGWADVFVSAGGDGTFLNVASQLRGGEMLIGLNTDPDRSYGHLCVRGIDSTSSNLKCIISKIASGRCTFIKRHRIRVMLTYPGTGETVEPEVLKYYALNDVYIGEKSPTRLSYMELKIDNFPPEKQKSSGLVICTGSGSTAWGYNINRLDQYHTEGIMSTLHERGLLTHKPTSGELHNMMERFNQSFVFNANDWRMKYMAREPLLNINFEAVNTHGFAKSISVRSLCWNGKIVMDGVQRKLNFDDGVMANFSTIDADSINSIQYVE